MKANVPAPIKLSEAIHMALKDQEIVENTPGMKIDMLYWHNPLEEGGKCYVCFAGAVMHCRFDLRTDDSVQDFRHFEEEWCAVFGALNALRCGQLRTALGFYGHGYGDFEDFSPISYSLDREGFRKQMLEVATMLEEKGL